MPLRSQPPEDAAGALPPHFCFGTAELSVPDQQLRLAGVPVALGGRAFALLCVLITHRDRVVSKNELLERVWAGLVVEENNLQVQISTLRRLLGAQVIATVPGRGYRFMATLAGDAPAAPLPAPADLATPAGNLPARVPELYGREVELAAVQALLEHAPLVSVVGPGGIGKTHLALAVAQAQRQHHPDGVWLVALAAQDGGALLPTLVAQAMRLTLPNHQPLLDELVAALQPRHMLLVLDNCEHLLPAVCALLARLFSDAPGVQVLLTSQERLKLPGEQVYRLAPLAVPLDAGDPGAADYGALRLLVERVRALQPGFVLQPAQLPPAIDICRQLDGLALAIELAAARVPLLGLQGVRDRLGERFRVLTSGTRLAPARHQTLQAALDWSHSLLSADEKTVYRRLGVFAGAFSMATAQALASDAQIDAWAVLEHLSALVDKSLVLAEGEPEPRLRLLESTRAHAQAQLAAAGEAQAWQTRHAACIRTLAERAVRERDTHALRADMPNVRSAFAWACGPEGDAATAVSLATAPAVLLAVDGAVTEALDRLLAVEPLVDARLPDDLAALFWQWLGRLGVEGRLPSTRCIAALERAIDLFTRLGNRRHLHACMRHLAEARIATGDWPKARSALQAAQAMEDAHWPVADVMRRLRVEALLYAHAGLLHQGLETAQRALDIAGAAHIERYQMVLLDDIARMHLDLGNASEAEQRFRALAGQARRTANGGLTLSHALSGLVAALTARGEFDAALAAADEAVPLLRRCGIFLARADVLACLMARRRSHDSAMRLLGAADRFRAACGSSRDVTESRCRDQALALSEAACPAQKVRQWQAEGAAASDDELAGLVTAARAEAIRR